MRLSNIIQLSKITLEKKNSVKSDANKYINEVEISVTVEAALQLCEIADFIILIHK